MRTRKQWLEIFIRLADTGAAAIEYRKRLRIKPAALKVHINRLTKYRNELKELLENERLDAAQELARREKEEENARRTAEEALNAERDTEALGTRDDSGDKPDVYGETNLREIWGSFKPTVPQDEDGDDVSS